MSPKISITVSEPYYDERDGNKSRPHCIAVSVFVNGKVQNTFIVRTGSDAHCNIVYQFLLKELNDEGNDHIDFINLVRAAQNGTNDIARRNSQTAHEAEAA